MLKCTEDKIEFGKLGRRLIKADFSQRWRREPERARRRARCMNSETMRTEPEMISTQEAAAILNVSLPYLAKLIESGELNAVKIGSSLCLSRAGVRRYKDASIKQRKAALDMLAQL